MIPYNAQHGLVRYGCCVFICGPATVNEVLSVKYEVSNPYDHYAIVKKRLPTHSVVSHTYVTERALDIMLHGASVAAKVITRSP